MRGLWIGLLNLKLSTPFASIEMSFILSFSDFLWLVKLSKVASATESLPSITGTII